MAVLSFSLDGDGCWPDLKEVLARGDLIRPSAPLRLALLKSGMTSGRPSVAVRVDLDDGRVVWTQVSLAQLVVAVKAMNEATSEVDWPEIGLLVGEPDYVREHARLRAALRKIGEMLTIPAAEYVPAISDVFDVIDEALRPAKKDVV